LARNSTFSARSAATCAVKLIFYSSNLQGIDRTAETAPEERLGTTFSVIGGVGRD
jgi:hypothetical protein